MKSIKVWGRKATQMINHGAQKVERIATLVKTLALYCPMLKAGIT